MKNALLRELKKRDWEVETKANHTCFNVLNGNLAFITFHQKELRYELRKLTVIYIPYADILRFEDDYLILTTGKILIADR